MGKHPPSRHRRNYNLPGHAHELTFSCFHRIPFLRAERTCNWLVESISEARVKLDFDLWAWVFMPDHVHLIIRPNRKVYDVAAIRRLIKEPVAQHAIAWLKINRPDWLKRIETKRGDRFEYHFWQLGGGYDRNITESSTLLSMIEYIHLNPVRKGLVEKPTDWKWSSASWLESQAETSLIPDSISPDWTAN